MINILLKLKHDKNLNKKTFGNKYWSKTRKNTFFEVLEAARRPSHFEIEKLPFSASPRKLVLLVMRCRYFVAVGMLEQQVNELKEIKLISDRQWIDFFKRSTTKDHK